MRTGDGTNYTLTPNMSLMKFTPGVCGPLGVEPPGASWGELINRSFDAIDQHNHASGLGARVPSAGLTINADLPFQGNNATQLRAAKFTAQGGPLSPATDIGALYVAGQDLYFNDAIGNVIRLTASGAIAGTNGSIAGLASPAAVTYTPASKLFDFTSNSGIRANLWCGPLSIYDPQAGGHKATLQVPVGLAADYALTLPTAMPGSRSFLTLDNTGAITVGVPYSAGLTTANLAANAGILGTQLASSAGILGTQLASNAGILGSQLAASAGIVGTQLASNAGILGTQLASNTVTRSQLASVGQVLSASSGSFSTASGSGVDVTNLSVTLSTTGRPVVVALLPDGGSFSAWVGVTGGGSVAGTFFVLRDGGVVGEMALQSTGSIEIPPGVVSFVDTPTAASHTYKIQASISLGSATWVTNCKLMAYEL